MKLWTHPCPQCGTLNTIPRDNVIVECGQVTGACRCDNCRHKFTAKQDYSHWLGLEDPPPDELTPSPP